ncbi:hypothetical protein V500_09446 [Pseudogymnoascus sp. VKM F-4518 (FW-2643)]|nr:hypothetical protein V500_09446 [Pseudogymnoascus sp. VKM F-4518 (FW-2643)]
MHLGKGGRKEGSDGWSFLPYSEVPLNSSESSLPFTVDADALAGTTDICTYTNHISHPTPATRRITSSPIIGHTSALPDKTGQPCNYVIPGAAAAGGSGNSAEERRAAVVSAVVLRVAGTLPRAQHNNRLVLVGGRGFEMGMKWGQAGWGLGYALPGLKEDGVVGKGKGKGKGRGKEVAGGAHMAKLSAASTARYVTFPVVAGRDSNKSQRRRQEREQW